MNAWRKSGVSVCALAFLCLVFSVTAYGQKATVLIAFSLREASRMVQDGSAQDDALKRLGGMTTMLGFAVDNEGGDTILIGRSDPGAPPLTLDDLVVAVRVTQGAGLSGPLVSINPVGKLESADHQEVRFVGGIDKTGIGKSLFEADYLTKRIALAVADNRVPSVPTYADRVGKAVRDRAAQSWNISSRFWFFSMDADIDLYPTKERPTLMFLENCGIVALDETLYAEVDGKVWANPSTFVDEPARGFTTDLTLHFRAFQRNYPEFARIDAIFRLFEIAKKLLVIGRPADLSTWLKSYRPAVENIPRTVPILRRTLANGRSQLVLQGGVRLGALASRIQHKDLSAVGQAVLSARPSSRALTWTTTFEQDWLPVVPTVTPEEQASARLFLDGIVSYERGDYVTALQRFEAFLRSYPDSSEALFLKLLAQRDWAIKQGKPENATDIVPILAKLADDLPNVIEARYELGVTLRVLGRGKEAIQELNRVLAARPDYAPAYHALGLAYFQQSDEAQAKASFERYLQLETNPNSEWARRARELLDQLAQDKRPTPSEGAMLVPYADRVAGIAVEYPQGWEVLSGQELREKILPGMAATQAVAVAFVNPKDPNQNINIRITDINAEALTDSDIAATIPKLDTAYQAAFPKLRKVEAGSVTVGNIKGIRYVLKCERAGVPLQQCVVTLVKARKAYTVTFTAGEEFFDRLSGTFDRVLTTFRVESDRG